MARGKPRQKSVTRLGRHVSGLGFGRIADGERSDRAGTESRDREPGQSRIADGERSDGDTVRRARRNRYVAGAETRSASTVGTAVRDRDTVRDRVTYAPHLSLLLSPLSAGRRSAVVTYAANATTTGQVALRTRNLKIAKQQYPSPFRVSYPSPLRVTYPSPFRVTYPRCTLRGFTPAPSAAGCIRLSAR